MYKRQAYQGEIEIQSGSVLGAGVLIIGRSTIGDHACVGPTTTIFNASVAPHAIVPAGSLLGDTSRQLELEPLTPPVLDEPDTPSPWDASGEVQTPEPTPAVLDESPDISTPEVPVLAVEETEVSKVGAEPTAVVGQVYIDQLLLTLFPERRHFKSQQKWRFVRNAWENSGDLSRNISKFL